MTFDDILDQILDVLQRQGRVWSWALKRRFDLHDDDHLEALKDELIYAQRLAVDEEAKCWSGRVTGTASSPSAAAQPQPCAARLHPAVSGREDSHLPRRPGRRAQAGHRAVCRPQGLHGVDRRPRSRSRPAAPGSGPAPA